MTAYNGNAREYWDQKRSDYQQQLQQIWQQAVQVTKEGNQRIADLAEEFKGVHSGNLDKQQQVDRELAEHMDSLYERTMGFQAETDRVHDDMEALLSELSEPFQTEVGGSGSDRASLERMWRQS